MRSWMDQYCRPYCTVLPTLSWEVSLLEPLVITSAFEAPSAVEAILRDYDLAGPGFLTGSIKAASRNLIAHGKITQLHNFLCQKGIGLTPQTMPMYMHAMAEWMSPAQEAATTRQGISSSTSSVT